MDMKYIKMNIQNSLLFGVQEWCSDDIYAKNVYLKCCSFVKCVPNFYKWNCGFIKFIIIFNSE